MSITCSGTWRSAPTSRNSSDTPRLAAALDRSRDFFVKTYGADLPDPPSDAQIIAPRRTVALDADAVLELGGRRLTVRAWPTAHTDCDVSVYDSASRTLFTGDLVFVQRTPALDGSILGWLKVLDALASARVAHVVPGHGPAGSELQPAAGGAARLPRTHCSPAYAGRSPRAGRCRRRSGT